MNQEALAQVAYGNFDHYCNSETATVAVVDSVGYFESSCNHACHAGIVDLHDNVEDIALIVSGIQEGFTDYDITTPMHKRFMDWLVSRSPYADSFVDKDVDNILKQRVYLCTPHVPSNILGGGLIMSRMPWEYPLIIPIWDMLVQFGVDENSAYIFAQTVYPTTVGVEMRGGLPEGEAVLNFGENIYQITICPTKVKYSCHHQPLGTCSMTLDNCRRFVCNDPTNLNPNYYEFGGYCPVQGVFKDTDSDFTPGDEVCWDDGDYGDEIYDDDGNLLGYRNVPKQEGVLFVDFLLEHFVIESDTKEQEENIFAVVQEDVYEDKNKYYGLYDACHALATNVYPKFKEALGI